MNEQAFCTLDLAGDASLLAAKKVQRQGVGVVRLKQLLTLPLQLIDPTLLLVSFTLVASVKLSKLAPDELGQQVAVARRQLLLLPEQRHASFDFCDQHRPLPAVRPVLLFATAVEIRVHRPMAVLGVHDSQS